MTQSDQPDPSKDPEDGEPYNIEFSAEIKQKIAAAIEGLYNDFRGEGIHVELCLICYGRNAGNGFMAGMYTTPRTNLRMMHDILCPRVGTEPDTRVITGHGETTGRLQ